MDRLVELGGSAVEEEVVEEELSGTCTGRSNLQMAMGFCLEDGVHRRMRSA